MRNVLPGELKTIALVRVCTGCGTEFSYCKAPGSRGRLRHFCSEICRKKVALLQAPHCKHYSRKYPRKVHTRICRGCGNEYQSYQSRSSFCSPQCVKVHQALKPRQPLRTPLTCKHCSKSFTPCRPSAAQRAKGHIQQFCSKSCRFDHIRAANTSQEALRWRENNRRYFEVNRGWRAPLDKRAKLCAGCGLEFASHLVGQIYCSVPCRSSYHRRVNNPLRRTLTRSGDKIDPLVVFALASYVCHLCGKQTDQASRGTWHPRAPELDHVVPIARGGMHTWDNVACACRLCNITKRDKITLSHLVKMV